MRIVLDAMGTDDSPAPEIAGAVEASLRDSRFEILLTGDEERLRPALERFTRRGNITIVHAPEAIGMHESPVQAIRTKKQSSLVTGLRLVKNGEADGFVSAGNTGAVMVGARTVLGPIKGVAKSPLCTLMPTKAGKPVLVLDVGANVDCSARHLCQFAEMGMIYSQLVLNVKNPRVGLLNIGEEQAKGNDLAKKVHGFLKASEGLNFIGNVEPKAMFGGDADVVVCDGFVGNVVLKTSESVAGMVGLMLKRELKSSLLTRLGGLFSLGAFRRLKALINVEEYSGAPLLGVNGSVIILHGASTARGIANAIFGAKSAISCNLNDHIREGMQAMRDTEESTGLLNNGNGAS